jgi:hypothetical protein
MASARNLRALLPAMPASGNTVVADVSNYLSILQPVNAIQSNQQLGSWIIAQLNQNTSSPTTANGGMSTVNPGNGQILPPQVGYNLGSASIASITNDLNNTGRTIVISMQTAAASGNQLSVSVQGQAKVTVGPFLKFTTSVGASYDMSKAAGTSSSASVKITYAGYSLVPINTMAGSRPPIRAGITGIRLRRRLRTERRMSPASSLSRRPVSTCRRSPMAATLANSPRC